MNTSGDNSDNLRIYRKHAKPPSDALKTIRGGRLNGKTDISPQWRYEAMTDLFGPIGFGWKFEVVDRRTEAGPNGEVALFATVALRYKLGNEWSEPIVGSGGSMLVAKESGGTRLSDEADKMAITDALSVCFKLLGIASDVYRGRWDGSKYSGPTPEDASNGEPKPKAERKPRPANGPPSQPFDNVETALAAAEMIRTELDLTAWAQRLAASRFQGSDHTRCVEVYRELFKQLRRPAEVV